VVVAEADAEQLEEWAVTDNDRYPDVDQVAAVVDAHMHHGGWTPTDTDQATATAALTAFAEVPDVLTAEGSPPMEWRLDRLAAVSRRARRWVAGSAALSPPTVWLLLTAASAFERFGAYADDRGHGIWTQPDALREEVERGERSLAVIGEVLTVIAKGRQDAR
jgi:predicted transcriptional regulator